MNIENKKIIFNENDIFNKGTITDKMIQDKNGNKYNIYSGENNFILKISNGLTKRNIKLKYITLNEDEPEEPTPSTDPQGSFPQGFSSDNLVIIYHTDDSSNTYTSTLDLDSLNQMARDYMNNIGQPVDDNTIFYQKDSTEKIYVLVEKQDVEYNNSIINIDGKDYYKVYIAGSCEIVGFQDISGGSDFNLELGNGYYYDIANSLYLFICTAARLVYYNASETGFWRNGEAESDIKMFTSQNEYKNSSYYIGIGENIPKDESLPAISEDDNIILLFKAGTMRKLIVSDTIEDIEYFADIVNATDGIIISSSVKNIGDYAFYGSSISGTISLNAKKLESIGTRAFSGMSNLSLLNINSSDDGYSNMPSTLKYIGDYAFSGSSGVKKMNFLQCRNLETVGERAFMNCGNLRNFKYLQSQVEPDDKTNTQLFYLPPEQGSDGNYVPRTSNIEAETVTAGYSYNYLESNIDPAITEEEINNSKYTFLNCSNITWLCL